jgi:hypothetical protein
MVKKPTRVGGVGGGGGPRKPNPTDYPRPTPPSRPKPNG